ncbi:MAG: hypothetical protein WC637_11405, partial [Victivallales bacterium]
MERRHLGGIVTCVTGREDKDCRQVAGGPVRGNAHGTPPTWRHRLTCGRKKRRRLPASCRRSGKRERPWNAANLAASADVRQEEKTKTAGKLP